MANTSLNTTSLLRSNIWSAELKEIIKDELAGQGYVRWLTEFPDGTTFNIPSIGEATVRTYAENNPVVYDALDSGNLTFTINTYLQSGTYITEKARQDLYYATELESAFVPKEARAIAEKLETDIFSLPSTGTGGQTLANVNSINGAPHRWVADPTTAGGSNIMTVGDFTRALYSLKKAMIPDTQLICVVDPAVEFAINNLMTLTTGTNNAYNIMWEGIITSGIGRGPRFVRNIFGFDVYVSNYLYAPTSSEAINTSAVFAGGQNKTAAANTTAQNFFFSAWDQKNLPFIGAWRQPPKVDSEYNKDYQREEYVTTARYGLRVYRPENLVVVLSTNQA